MYVILQLRLCGGVYSINGEQQVHAVHSADLPADHPLHSEKVNIYMGQSHCIYGRDQALQKLFNSYVYFYALTK